MNPIDTVIVRATTLLTGLVLLCIGGVALFMVLYLLLQWWKHRDREEYSLKFVHLLVALPKDNEIKVDAAEQMFAGLHSLKNDGWFAFLKHEDHFAIEVVALHEDIKFYISCSEHLRDFIEKQVNGAYPGAEIQVVDEPNIFSEGGKVTFATLKEKDSEYFPIKTYKDLPTDSLSLLTSALSKMQEGEGAVVQFVIEPESEGWQNKGRSYLASTKKREADPQKASYSNDPKKLDSIDGKVSKPGFRTIIRIVVNSTNEQSANSHLTNIVGSFGQFTSPQNSLEKPRIWLKQLFMIDFIYRYMPLFGWRTSIFNSEELATMIHFPNKTVETHHIHWLKAKSSPAPASIPTSGLYIGKSLYRGVSKPIYISEKDRQRHMYIVGKTGTGKSEFLKDMILQDIRAGKGMAVIDPHGELVEDLLQMMPPDRAEEVIYFNPSYTERPMGLNMMEAETEEQMHFVAGSIIGLMYKLYDPHKTGIIGPRFEHAIRNAMLTIMATPGSTFIELVRVLTDQKFLQELLPQVKDPIVRRYWTDQIAQTSDFHKSEVLDYIVSKFGRFITNKTMRNIIGQSKSAFNLREVMDNGKILLVNLSKGSLGEEDAKFLGLIMVPKILAAAMSRVNVPMEQRRDFYLYVDEFQNFATQDFATILSEARKYKLNLVVANQFVAQIEEDVKNAVFGNVGTLVTFRVGVPDANFLQHEFAPIFTEGDLTNIERFHVYVKTIVGNEPVPAFSMDLTRDVDKERAMMNPKVAEMIKELSMLKYGIPRDIIEAEMAVRAKL
ncbi:MAG: type IV secretion system DNA-binding domain-containing protein [Candidatus Pacebacteria bacterium]|nr:type IV secretion system DNA-binding domain-containing protein [Candidatus Paceibacterota bacterium]